MKRIFCFGSFSDNSICKGIFITSFLILFRFIYFSSFSISIKDANIKKFIFNILVCYIRYLEPIVIITWLKFVCEFLFKILKRNEGMC